MNFTEALETVLTEKLQEEKTILVAVLCLVVWITFVCGAIFCASVPGLNGKSPPPPTTELR